MIGASLQTPTTIRSRSNKLYGEAKATHNVVAVGPPRSLSESRMRQIRTSGLMSGEGKRSHWPSLNATAPFLNSTIHALALYFQCYNFVRVHKTLRMSPAIAAGVTDKLWEIEDIVALIDARDERKRQSRAEHSMK